MFSRTHTTDPSPAVQDTTGLRRKKRFGWRRKGLLVILLLALFVIRVDTHHLSPARDIGSPYLFSLVEWEIAKFPQKWLHRLWDLLPWNGSTREERIATVEEYLELARRVEKEKDRVEGLLIRSRTAIAPGGIAKEKGPPSRDYLDELTSDKERLRAEAEEALEAEVSAILLDEGMGGFWGLIFPPVDIRLDKPPTLLVTSPRDRLDLTEAVLLDPDLPGFERDRLEKQMMEKYNVSALVDSLAGLATYPSLVNDLDTLREILQTTAHEWLHTYFFFRPLGRSFFGSQQMRTLNETIAESAGRDLGDAAFASMGGDLNESPTRYLPRDQRNPFFTNEMRKIRLRVEELLREGKVEEAEQYMREQQWRLRLGGYGLRKLNQAFFAFRGSYGESPASTSPIGDQVREMRGLFPDIGSFIRAVAGVSGYSEFLDLLEELRSRNAGS